jgi:hypothetical protein
VIASEEQAEHREVHEQVMIRAIQTLEVAHRRNSGKPWHAAKSCLGDFFVYAGYGHEREHSA